MPTLPLRPADGKATGVTIGNFDGVHRGHRRLIERTLDVCRERGLDCVAVTFWPHPRALFSGMELRPLADLHTRRRLLGALGVHYLYELNFNREMAALSPEEFYLAYLAPLDMKALVVGYDFHLGRNRSGDFDALVELGRAHGFTVERVPPLMDGDAPISSTRIRAAIEAGDLESARRMLGRPHAVTGTVVHGQGRGTGLGFPTANLQADRVLLPPDGVYATRVVHRRVAHAAVTNVGFVPTFNGTGRTIESFLLDCDLNLYHETVRVEFLERLRGERRFESPEALVAQIGRDVERGREINARLAPELSDDPLPA